MVDYAVSATELALRVQFLLALRSWLMAAHLDFLGAIVRLDLKRKFAAGRTHHAAEGYVNLSKSSGMVLRASGDGSTLLRPVA